MCHYLHLNNNIKHEITFQLNFNLIKYVKIM